MTLFLLLIIVVLVAVILWLLLRPAPPPVIVREPAPPPEPVPAPGPIRAVPDVVSPAKLPALLSPHFAGESLGDDVPEDATAVVWVDGTDEVIVYLDSIQATIVDQVVLIGIDLESDQTGRATLVVPFAIGSAPDGGFVFSTEATPRGPQALVGRWGEAVREAAYGALLRMVQTHADERGHLPAAFWAQDGVLHLRGEAP